MPNTSIDILQEFDNCGNIHLCVGWLRTDIVQKTSEAMTHFKITIPWVTFSRNNSNALAQP